MELVSGYPHLPLTERDRRQEAIRRKIAKKNLGVLLIHGHSGF